MVSSNLHCILLFYWDYESTSYFVLFSGCSGGSKYESDVKFTKQAEEIVIENHCIQEVPPTTDQDLEADNDSSFSNPVYSG